MDFEKFFNEIEDLMTENSVKYCVYGYKLGFTHNPLYFSDSYSCIFMNNYDDLQHYCCTLFCDYGIEKFLCVSLLNNHIEYCEFSFV